ncbi:GNAT family N-acetyltransferase [Pseudoalteromonas luteoviolacea]|uniref:N-acetyltransferase domain-containing protein n=1 Tax=Pseudoalteromonas luteoviolacea DSM 6061 TaxID=1365250 RepID=A0A166V421_9GAMM|nr:GNAT family N-acetyltransferase [Pseudoalteromonas luteoviolacea]KZN31686.1 hypothetical protein N475_04325 [Pseudoalteromonas luteoviolacea DSM 6061]MBE0389022.1 hypothetical protein [Pseudoalteromonas luteoviolacea DSM 6061]
MDYILRTAKDEDIPALREIIEASARGLSTQFYSSKQIELALQGALGVDSQLIEDRTYFCIEVKGEIVACGGWSYRSTLFGSDSEQSRNATKLDPNTQAAKVRAFFVKPNYARKGLGTLLMEKCEAEAIHKGYRKLELMATLPGVKLYEQHGFSGQETVEYSLSDDMTITFVPMAKQL